MHERQPCGCLLLLERNCMRFQKEQLKLYAITDSTLLKGGRSLPQAVEEAILGGATMVQLREKHLKDEALEEEAAAVLKVCRKYGVPFIVNDDPVLAAKIGADGVHVGQEDMEAARAREILGPDAIVGVTAKTVEQALRAAKDGADYLGSGAVFGSTTKTNALPMTKELLKEITKASSLPVTAIGGISAENALQLKGTGICGIAVVSGIFAAEDVEAAAKELCALSEEILRDPD